MINHKKVIDDYCAQQRQSLEKEIEELRVEIVSLKQQLAEVQIPDKTNSEPEEERSVATEVKLKKTKTVNKK